MGFVESGKYIYQPEPNVIRFDMFPNRCAVRDSVVCGDDGAEQGYFVFGLEVGDVPRRWDRLPLCGRATSPPSGPPLGLVGLRKFVQPITGCAFGVRPEGGGVAAAYQFRRHR